MKAGFTIHGYIWEGCVAIHVHNFYAINEIHLYSRALPASNEDRKRNHCVGQWKRKVEVGGGLVKKAEESEVKNNKQ